jgi:hypothetical protein
MCSNLRRLLSDISDQVMASCLQRNKILFDAMNSPKEELNLSEAGKKDDEASVRDAADETEDEAGVLEGVDGQSSCA